MIFNPTIKVALRIFITLSLLLSVNTFAAITFVGSTTNQGDSRSGASVTVPAGTQAGDVLIAQVVIGRGATSVSRPAGWFLIGNVEQSGDVQQSLYYKVASSIDAGNSYSWNFSGVGFFNPRTYILGMSVFRGVDNTTPIAASSASTGSVPNNRKIKASSVTTTKLESYLIAAYAVDEGSRSFSADSFMDESYDKKIVYNPWFGGPYGVAGMSSTEPFPAIGATGDREARVSNRGGSFVAHLVALNVASLEIKGVDGSCSNLSTVTLEFSKAVDSATAEDTNNYSLVSAGGNSVSITGASLSSDNVTLTLTLANDLNDLTPYTITVNNVEDLYGTAIEGNSSASFSLECGINCITEQFNGSGSLPSSWSVGHSAGAFGDPRIEGGRLRLTDSSSNVATLATLLKRFAGADNRIEIEFNHYAYGGGGRSGADGMAVIFSNADIAPSAGGYGGSLGYAQRYNIDGFAGGWLGIGIDEFGNFSNPNDGNKVGGPGRVFWGSVALRGSGSGITGYPYLKGIDTLNPGISVSTNYSSPTPGHKYKIVIDHTTGGRVANISVSRDVTGTGYTEIISEFDVFSENPVQADVPTDWMLSFTGSTGGATNIHEIDNFKVCAAQPIQNIVDAVDHYSIEHTSPGLTCEGSKVTITAHDADHNPIDVLNDTNIDISTTPSVNSIIPSTVTMLTGTSIASFYLQQTSALANININLTDGNFTDDEGSSEDPRISFLDAAFRFYADGSNTDANPIATQISGKPSTLAPNNQSLALRAVRTNTDTGACEAGVEGSQTVSFAYTCIDPNNCSAVPLVVSADETENITGTNTGSALAYSNLDMVFDANGSAPFNFTFSDAGKIQFHANLNVPEPSPNPDSDPAFTLTGSSNEFVVRPFAFDLGLTGIHQASGSGSTRFVSAGSNFPMTVRAVNWQAVDDANNDGIPDIVSDVTNNSSTPNFGQELNGSAQPLAITHTLTLPNPGNIGNLSSTSINTSAGAGFFTAGITDGNPAINVSWDEVGIINLDVSLNNYLSAAGANVTGAKTNVGRFYPASFSLTSSSLANSCAPANGDFSYMNQLGIGVSYDLEARNAAGVKTLNYDGGFAKATLSLVAENNNEGTEFSARLIGFDPTNWGNGDYTFSGTGSFNRLASGTPNVLDGPYQDLNIGVQLADNDGNVSALNGLNMRADTSTDCTADGNCNALALAGSLDVRFGQLKLNNVFGPETASLDMTVQTEYFDGMRFVVNTDDSCTVLTLTTPSLTLNFPGDTDITNKLETGETGPISTVSPSPPPPLVSSILLGESVIRFSASGIGNDGFATSTFNTTTYLPWLNTENDGDGDYANNPFGTVTFGQFRGNDRRLYWREIVR